MPKFSAHICLNGHSTSHSLNESASGFCTLCGAPLISSCRKCDEPIWTEAAISTAAEILADDIQIPEDERNRMVQLLPDVVSETPKTSLAVNLFAKGIPLMQSITKESFLQFATDFATDKFKSLLGI